MTTSLDTIRYHSGIAGEEVADMVDSLEQEVSTLREQVEKLTAALKLSREALGEVQDLIGESHGVYGLHLNGDESPWNELEQGGKFERLTSLNEALAAIDSLLKGE